MEKRKGIKVVFFIKSSYYKILTQKQIEIIECILRGYSYTEVAKKLKMKPNTIKWHLKIIYKKLKIKTRRGLFTLFEKI